MLRRLMQNKAIMAAASILFGIYLIIARSSALYTVIRILGYGLLEEIPHFATVSYAFCKRFPAE